MNVLIRRNYEVLLIIGIGLLVGGISLAYFVERAPWDFLGGALSALGLFFTAFVYSTKNK